MEKGHIKKDINDWNRVLHIGVTHHIPQLVHIAEINKQRDRKELRK